MKQLATAILSAAVITPLSLAAYDLTINGQTISVDTVTTTTTASGIVISTSPNVAVTFGSTTSGGSTSSTSGGSTSSTSGGSTSSTSGGSTSSTSGGSTSGGGGSCGSTPSGVTVQDAFDLGSPGSQERIDMYGNGTIVAMPFTSTNNSGYEGQFAIASTTGNSGVQRTVWVSECPGGEPMVPESRCERQGWSTTVVKWIQNTSTSKKCQIPAGGGTYYLNVRNEDCPGSSCDVYRAVYTNGNP